MTVLNYPTAIIYEIYTSEGYIYMKYCKAKKVYEVETIRPCPAYELLDSPNSISESRRLSYESRLR